MREGIRYTGAASASGEGGSRIGRGIQGRQHLLKKELDTGIPNVPQLKKRSRIRVEYRGIHSNERGKDTGCVHLLKC